MYLNLQEGNSTQFRHHMFLPKHRVFIAISVMYIHTYIVSGSSVQWFCFQSVTVAKERGYSITRSPSNVEMTIDTDTFFDGIVAGKQVRPVDTS